MCDTSKLEAPPLSNKSSGGAIGGVWRKNWITEKVNNLFF